MVLSTIKFDKRAYDSSEAKYGKLPLKTDIVVESGYDNIYVYTYVYIYMYISICVYIHTYVYIYI